MREDLIKSAVSFLADPKVQSAPLAKKVSFLESKGMTSEEIAEAMARVNGKSSGSSQQQQAALVNAPAPPVPARPSYDWRNIFIAAVLAGGVTYGLWTLAKRVFGPWFNVPTQEQLEEEKKALDSQFQAVEDSLKEIKDQTEEALSSVSAQSDKVNDALSSLEAVLEDLKKGDESRDKEFKSVKADVDSLKELVPKLLDRNKEAQSVMLNELQNELKSLKSLLAARRTPTTTTSSSLLLEQASGSNGPVTESSGISPLLSSTLNGNNRAGIPAWQLAATPSSSTAPQQPESSKTNNHTPTPNPQSTSSASVPVVQAEENQA